MAASLSVGNRPGTARGRAFGRIVLPVFAWPERRTPARLNGPPPRPCKPAWPRPCRFISPAAAIFPRWPILSLGAVTAISPAVWPPFQASPSRASPSARRCSAFSAVPPSRLCRSNRWSRCWPRAMAPRCSQLPVPCSMLLSIASPPGPHSPPSRGRPPRLSARLSCPLHQGHCALSRGPSRLAG